MIPEAITIPLNKIKLYAAMRLMILMQAVKVFEEGCSTFSYIFGFCIKIIIVSTKEPWLYTVLFGSFVYYMFLV